jgi:hypothetical protein
MSIFWVYLSQEYEYDEPGSRDPAHLLIMKWRARYTDKRSWKSRLKNDKEIRFEKRVKKEPKKFFMQRRIHKHGSLNMQYMYTFLFSKVTHGLRQIKRKMRTLIVTGPKTETDRVR